MQMHFTDKLRYTVLMFLTAIAAGLTSCSDSFIFDYEGDCDPKYRVRLHYDWHLKFSDAFAAEVDHVTLNVIDSEGNIVYTHQESGDALAQPGYEIVLDGKIKPGKYRLQAWCGSGAMPGNTSFVVHEASKLTDLRCTLLPDPESKASLPEGADGKDIERELADLYHGMTEELDFPEEEGTHTYDMGLKKNTNSVMVVLQHMSGLPVDGNLFDFTITTANAHMDYDNKLIASAPVTYHAWNIRNGSAVITDEYAAPGSYSATVAEFTVARLVKGEDVRLEARRKSDGQLVFSIPLIDMALLFKRGKYNKMSDQEYLDRQNEYNFVFFIDEGYRWIDSFIYINSWKFVSKDYEI